ncbi:hypothetical protein WCN91_03345 [Pseudoalteromonas sp. YIC-827]|uniref:Lipoprotein n=1 Tax=Pseudoalteromonas qingdaonensis TaxID=3131913 RepID=A0ABU9MT54_9GAMM
MKKSLLIMCLVLTLCGCSKPIPRERVDYIGYWQGVNMELYIHPDGAVSYVRQDGNTSKSINASIQEFEGDDFIVGFGFFNTRFAVTQAPQEIDGQYQMVVDGVLLIKRM